MDVSFTSVLDFDGITRSCWKICDSDVGLKEYKVNRSTFPLYRDDNTRAAFHEVADFFGCVDICQSTNESERLTLLFPIGLGAFVILCMLTCLLWYFCKRCTTRKPVMINILDDTGPNFWLSPNSSTTSKSTVISDFRKPTAFTNNNKVEDFGGVRPFTVNSWIEDNSSKLIGLESEMNASERMKSEKEANDPRKITKSTSPNGKMVKKKKIDAKTQRLLDSSRKLGRRLISMDIQSEKKDKK